MGDFFPEEAVIYLKRAFRLLAGDANRTLAFAAAQGLGANLLASDGDHSSISTCLQVSEKVALGVPILEAHHRWLRGKVEAARGGFEAALQNLGACVATFRSIELVPYAAIAGLDLATMCLDVGKVAEAAAFSLEVAPVLDSLAWSGEEAIAIQTLFASLKAGKICTSSLDSTRKSLAVKARAL